MKQLINRFGKSISCKILLLPLMAILVGCSTVKGPIYSDVEKNDVLQPSPGKALIFVYSHYLPLGETFYVWANEKRVSSVMSNDRFIYFQADAGELHIASKANKTASGIPEILYVDAIKTPKVSFTVAPGEVYYVDMHNGFMRETMSLVSKEEGGRKVKTCYLAPEPTP